MTRFALLFLPVVLLAGCSAEAPAAAPRSSPAACGSPIVADALPTWARAGFSTDGSGTPHVFGRSGDIIAVFFGSGLYAPPLPNVGNKILWVAHTPASMGDTLYVDATLAGTTETAQRKVDGGPGPSGIDLPRPGCWHVTLRWSGHTDTMDLTYVRPSPASASTE